MDYNVSMKRFISLLIFIDLVLALLPRAAVQAQAGSITTADIINSYNSMRAVRGLAPLIVDPILMATAQETAEVMALYQLHDHIGNVRGRVMAAGYGGGDTAWATENWAMGGSSFTLSALLAAWADESHMIPAVNGYYQHIGAGIAEYNGFTYYILHAAYTSNGVYETTPVSPNATQDVNAMATAYVSQIIFPVHTSTPNPGGAWLHEVRSGQSLWSIAIAYDTHIVDLQRINGMPEDDTTIYAGQKIYLPTPEIAPDVLAVTATADAAPQTTPDGSAQTLTTPLAPTPQATTGISAPRPTATAAPRANPSTPTLTAAVITASVPKSPPQVKTIAGYILIGVAGIGLLLVILGAVLKK